MIINIFGHWINPHLISHIERCSWYAEDNDKVQCKLWMISGSPIQLQDSENTIAEEINKQSKLLGSGFGLTVNSDGTHKIW